MGNGKRQLKLLKNMIVSILKILITGIYYCITIERLKISKFLNNTPKQSNFTKNPGHTRKKSPECSLRPTK